MSMVLRFGLHLLIKKTTKYYHDCYWKCDVLLLADVFGKFRKN